MGRPGNGRCRSVGCRIDVESLPDGRGSGGGGGRVVRVRGPRPPLASDPRPVGRAGLRAHVATDRRGSCPAPLRRLPRPVRDPGRLRRGTGGRHRGALAGPRVQPTGREPAPERRRDHHRARWPAPHDARRFADPPRRRPLHGARRAGLRPRAAGRGARHQRAAHPVPPPRPTRHPVRRRCPRRPRRSPPRRRVDLEPGADGARRHGVPAPPPVRRVPGGSPLRLAPGGPDRTRPLGQASPPVPLRGQRPPRPRPPRRRPPIGSGARGGPARRDGLARRPRASNPGRGHLETDGLATHAEDGTWHLP